jgi:hypothetical protein
VTKSALIEKVSRMIKVDASLKKPAMLGAKGGLTAPQGPKGSFHWVLSGFKRLPTTNYQPATKSLTSDNCRACSREKSCHNPGFVAQVKLKSGKSLLTVKR